MGFDNECILNIQSLPGEYFCPVCRTLVYPHEALQTQCTHLYCKPCLAYVVATTRACPYDGYLVTEVDSKPLMDSNKPIAEAINKIQVHCLYHRSGCQWQGSMSDCVTHCTECTFGNSPVVCNRCGTQIIHRQVQEHAQICPGVQPQAQQAGVGQSQSSTEQNQGTQTVPQAIQDSSSQSAAAASAAVHVSSAASTVIPANVPATTGVTTTQANASAQPQVPQAQSQEQWYQQQQQQLQYQQYYQQYPGYDPYQQHNQYQQQAYAQYYSQPQPVQAPQQAVAYAQPQPQVQPPVYQSNLQPVPQQSVYPQHQLQSMPQAQPQPQPQPQPQQQPQAQPQSQPQPHLVSQSQLHPQAQMPQMQAPPNVQQQIPIASQQAHVQAQMQPLANPPQMQMATQPLGSLPVQTAQHPQHQLLAQHPQISQPQMQPHVQPQLAQQLPVQQQQHLNPLPQSQPQTVTQPQLQPQAQVQPQNASAHAVTGHQSYPQHQLQQAPTAVPQQRAYMHPQQQLPHHPTQVQSQGSNQMTPVRPSQTQVPLQPQQPNMALSRPGYNPNQPAVQQHAQYYPGMQSSIQNQNLPHQQVRGQVPPQQGTYPSPHAAFPQQPFRPQTAPYGQQHLPPNQPAQQPTSMMPAMPLHPAQTELNKTAMTGHPQSSAGQVSSAGGPGAPVGNDQLAGKAPESKNLVESVTALNDVTAAPGVKNEKHEGSFSSENREKKHADGDISGAPDRDPSQVSQDRQRNEESMETSKGVLSDKEGVSGKLKEQTLDEAMGRPGNVENKMNSTSGKPNTMHVEGGPGDKKSNMQSEADGSVRPRLINSGGNNSDLVGQSYPQQGESRDRPNFQSGYPERRNAQFPPQGPPAGGPRAPPPYGQMPPADDAMLRPPAAHSGPGFQGPSAHSGPGFQGPSAHSGPGFQGPLPHHVPMQGPNHLRPVHGISENAPYQGQPPAPGPYHAEVPPSGFQDPGLNTAVRGQPPVQPVGGRIPPGDMFTGPPNGMPPESMMLRGPHPGLEGPHSQTNLPFPVPSGRAPNTAPGPFESRQTEYPHPGSMEHGSLGRSFPHPNTLSMNGPPDKLAEHMPFNGPRSERFAGSSEGRYKPFPDEGYKRPADDQFKPFSADPTRHIDRRELEEDLKQFPRHPNFNEGHSKFDSYSSRPLDKGSFGWGSDSGSRTFDRSSNAFGPDGGRKIDELPGAIPSRLPPPYHIDSFPGDRPPTDDSIRKYEFGHPRSDTGVLGREFGGLPFNRSEGGSASHGFSHFDDYTGRDSQIFGERPRPFNLPSDSVGNARPPLSSSQISERTRMIEQFGSGNPRPNELDGPDYMRNSYRSAEPLGPRAMPGSGSPRDFRNQFPLDEPGRVMRNWDSFAGDAPMRFGDSTFGGNYHPHGFSNESAPFNFGAPPKDDSYFSDHQRKRKPGSAGWCRICKIDCENVEGLDLHSQTREHQKMAMDIVLNIKKNNAKKKKKPYEDNMSLDDGAKMKFSSFESRGNKN